MSDLLVATTIDSQWATGYQMSVKITNQGSAPITWSATIAVDGKITDLWNASSTPSGAKITFTGKDFNAVLDAGASTSFGFVATK
jgi:cellulase/cellobiase CelA1